MSEDDDEERRRDLDWRDCVAISIAALETVLLPFVIVVMTLIVLFIIIR